MRHGFSAICKLSCETYKAFFAIMNIFLHKRKKSNKQ